MATQFPEFIDDFQDPAATDPMNTPSHSAQHADVNDAVKAIETAIGTTALPILAPLISPAFAGTPTVPTAPLGTNTIQAASTAFVLESGVSLDGAGHVQASQMRPFNYRGVVANNTTYNPWDLVLLGSASAKPGARALITTTVTSGSTGFISSADFIQLTAANVFYASDYGITANDNGGTDYSVPFNALQVTVSGMGGGLVVMPQGIVYGSSPFVLQSLVYTTFNGAWNNSGFRTLAGANCDTVQTSVRITGTPSAWVSATNYAQSSLVSYNSKFYYCLWGISNNSTLTPDIDNGNWSWVNSPVGSTNAFFYGLKDCMIHGDNTGPSATAFNNGFVSLTNPRSTSGSGDLDFDTEGRIQNVFVRSATGHGFVKIGRSEDLFDGCWSEACGGTAFATSFDTQMVSCKAESYGLGGFADKNSGDVKWTGLNAFNGGTVPQFTSLYVAGSATVWTLSSQNGVGNGTFTITVPAGTTAAIAWNASGSTIAAAVSAIAGFSGTCTGTGSAVSTALVTLTFSATQATLTVAQTQTWASGGSAMYLGSLYKAKSAQTNYTGTPSTDTTNWQLIYAAPEWGIPYYVSGANAANVMIASCGSNANPAHGLLLQNCVGVNAQVNLTYWNATSASVNNATNPNNYCAVVLDNCSGCIVNAACLGGTSPTGYDLTIINGATKNIVHLVDDGTVSTFLSPGSTAIAASGNDVTYNGVHQSPAAVGVPTVPTALAGTNNTTAASTAFVQAASSGTTQVPNKPQDFGYLGWSIDPAEGSGASTNPTAGFVYLVRFRCVSTSTLGHVYFDVVAAGTSQTTNENFIGIYDTGQTTTAVATLLGTSADQSTNFATGALYDVAITAQSAGTLALTGGQDYFFAILCNNTGSSPSFQGASYNRNLANAGLTQLNLRQAFDNVGSKTALPATIAQASIAVATANTLFSLLATT